MRRVLVAVSGLLFREFLDRVLGQLSWSDAELHLVHIVDARPLREFGLAVRGLPGRGGQASERLRQMGALGGEAGQKMLAEAEVLASHRLPPGTAIRKWQRTGVPEQEIVAAAYEAGATIIVLGAAEDPAGPPPPPKRHGRPEPREPDGRPEPWRREGPPKFPRRHLSPTVRFVVDHAPCDVLLLYAGELRKIAM
jgi:nucleotide-binding universal stress UspA family protein